MFGVCLDIDIYLPLYIPGKYFHLHITLHWSAYLIIFDKSQAMFTSLLKAKKSDIEACSVVLLPGSGRNHVTIDFSGHDA